MPMYIQELQKYIPHRYPFLLIDRMLEFNASKDLTAIKNVTVNEPCFTGHFPEMPIFPGALTLEALAQASGLLARLSLEALGKTDDVMYYLAGIDNTKFKQVVLPGDQLKLHVELMHQKRQFSIFKTKCTATVDDKVVCTAEILCAMKGEDHE